MAAKPAVPGHIPPMSNDSRGKEVHGPWVMPWSREGCTVSRKGLKAAP